VVGYKIFFNDFYQRLREDVEDEHIVATHH